MSWFESNGQFESFRSKEVVKALVSRNFIADDQDWTAKQDPAPGNCSSTHVNLTLLESYLLDSCHGIVTAGLSGTGC